MKDVTAVVEEVNKYGVEHVEKMNADDATPHNWFGRSVVVSADKSILVVGANGGTTDYITAGSVYIYKRDAGLNTYNPVHIQKLTASDRAVGDWFGASVSLSADKSILVVGANGVNDGDTDTGSVYIYKQDAGLDTYNPVHIQKLTASDRTADDWFGVSVSLSTDKSILVVGAYGSGDSSTDTAGSVYIYKQDAGLDTYNPAHIQKLTASDSDDRDWFGSSVLLTADKSTLIVGSPWDNDGGTNAGSVYIYKRDAVEDTYNPAHIQKLTASDGAALDLFGASVAISADKNMLIVGAYGDDNGGTNTGAVYIYKRDAGLATYNPAHIQKLNASDRADGDIFGASVAISADKNMLIVGAYGDDDGGTNTGSVYIYKRDVCY